MTATLKNALEEISRLHFPNPPATTTEINQFEARIGWQLDDDLRTFYLHCNGADLFGKPDASYRILPLSGIKRARVALLGTDDDSAGPASWYAICSNQDLDYMAIDVSVPGRYPVYDCWHETFPDLEDAEQIADSFSAFLIRALQSSGKMYWLKRSG